ncbi:MAG: hypothetical protein ACM3SR_11790 [Ignavibacteriales bacterium]
MRQKLLYLLMIIPFLLFVLIITSHEDEENVEYKSGNRDQTPSLFSAMRSDVVRIARNVREPQCWRSNLDDPRGEILKGVDCPSRLRIMDKETPIKKCIGMLILKHRARDRDLTFDVLPDEEYKYLTNPVNVRKMKGGLHCEIVPNGRARCEGIFNGMGLNSIVEVEGVWVEDKNHRNWRELHPVTSLKLLKKGD